MGEHATPVPTATRTAGAELHVEVLGFYARQMRLIGELRVPEYVATFTEDGVIDHAHRGERVVGRQAMLASIEAALPRYRGVVVRHWFDHVLVEEIGDELHCSYCALVTKTDASGAVALEPTYTVHDVLVRRDGALRTKSRTIHRDTPADGAAS